MGAGLARPWRFTRGVVLADRKPFLLRLPPELMDALNLWAKDELRSLNAQIEFLLRDAIRKHRTRRELPNPQGPDGDHGDTANEL